MVKIVELGTGTVLVRPIEFLEVLFKSALWVDKTTHTMGLNKAIVSWEYLS